MPNPNWLDWSRRLQALAQTGLTYTQSQYDRERYAEILRIAAEITAAHTNAEADQLLDFFSHDSGYATPKVDVRAVVFKDDQILMVKERIDSLWTLPGGWADVGDSPSSMAVREVREESGYEVCAVRLLALYDRDAPHHGHPPIPWHSYKVFFLCNLIGGEPSISNETEAVGFFPLDSLPPLSIDRVTESEIHRVYALHRDPTLPPDFD